MATTHKLPSLPVPLQLLLQAAGRRGNAVEQASDLGQVQPVGKLGLVAHPVEQAHPNITCRQRALGRLQHVDPGKLDPLLHAAVARPGDEKRFEAVARDTDAHHVPAVEGLVPLAGADLGAGKDQQVARHVQAGQSGQAAALDDKIEVGHPVQVGLQLLVQRLLVAGGGPGGQLFQEPGHFALVDSVLVQAESGGERLGFGKFSPSQDSLKTDLIGEYFYKSMHSIQVFLIYFSVHLNVNISISIKVTNSKFKNISIR